MIALSNTLPGRVFYPGGVARFRARFVDEETDVDQTPASVVFLLRGPGGSLGEYTWTSSTPPTTDAALVAFSKTTTASTTIFEATVAIASDASSGTWTFGWRALDGSDVELVTTWGAIDVEAEASAPHVSTPLPAPQNPYDEIGADVWSRGSSWPGYWYW